MICTYISYENTHIQMHTNFVLPLAPLKVCRSIILKTENQRYRNSLAFLKHYNRYMARTILFLFNSTHLSNNILLG